MLNPLCKAQKRDEWMGKHGFSKVGSLSKQRSGIADKLRMGLCREMEQSILNAVDLSGALVGKSTCSLETTLGWYKATFDLGDGTLLSKRCESLKQVNDWLLSTAQSYKSGQLNSAFKNLASSAKPAVDLEKAAHNTCSEPLTASICEISGHAAAGSTAEEDITAEFLSADTAAEVELPATECCLHKGSLNTFASMASSEQSIGALLLGKEAWNGKLHITQIVLTKSPPESIVDHERITARCKSLGLVPCGILVVGELCHWTRDRVKEFMSVFLEHCNTPLVVLYDFSTKITGERSCWEYLPAFDDWVLKTVTWATQPRDNSRRLVYNICWLEELGVSHLQATSALICKALLQQVQERIAPTRRCIAATVFLRVNHTFCGQ